MGPATRGIDSYLSRDVDSVEGQVVLSTDLQVAPVTKDLDGRRDEVNVALAVENGVERVMDPSYLPSTIAWTASMPGPSIAVIG
jgi:hypothetical protein